MKRKASKKLVLNRETLRSLNRNELWQVVGGEDLTVEDCPSGGTLCTSENCPQPSEDFACGTGRSVCVCLE